MTDIKNKLWPSDGRTISNLIVVLIGITFYIALSNFDVVRAQIAMLLNVLSPFVAGFVIAFLLNSPMQFFENGIYQNSKYRRVLSIITVYLLALVVLTILLNLVLPQVAQSVLALGNNLPGYLDNFNDLVSWVVEKFKLEGDGIEALVVSYQDLMNKASTIIAKALPQILNLGVAVGSGVITAVTALICSIYMLAGKHTLIYQLKKLIYAFAPKEKADHFLTGCHRANGIFVGFINGKLIDSAIIGVLCFTLCMVFRIPFAVLVSVIVGVTNIIPFFGPIIGAVPCLMILIIVDPWAALRFGFLVIALQQFDGNILGPKILGDSTGLSAIWVLVAIITGGGLFGFVGMVLGVPTFAVLYMIMRDVVSARLAARGIDGSGKQLPNDKVPKEE